MTLYSEYKQVRRDIADTKAILHDENEDQDLKETRPCRYRWNLKIKKKNLDREIKLVLLPKDPNDERNTFLEIRAGTGGDEAALFVAELFRMYSRLPSPWAGRSKS
jgi:peptide chain release factor 1